MKTKLIQYIFCMQCGKIEEKTRENRCKLLCSKECIKNYKLSKIKPLELITKHCIICGTEFQTYTDKNCCSKKCSNSIGGKINKHKKKTLKCSVCNKEFIVGKNCSNKNTKCDECKNKHKIAIKPKKYKIPKVPKIKRKRIYKKRQIKCKICGIINCTTKTTFCKSYSTIKKYFIAFSLNLNTLSTVQVFNEFHKLKPILEKEYIENRLSIPQITDKYKLSSCGTTRYLLKILNIQRRTLLEANFNYTLSDRFLLHNGVRSKYKQGWHTTWNNKKVFYRSSYELKYMKELDQKKIDYEVEKLKFNYYSTVKNKFRKAIPDFYIPNTNTIIEIKSCYTLNIQEMRDKAFKYIAEGYDFKLIVDFKDQTHLI